jgi:hypothetical protein
MALLGVSLAPGAQPSLPSTPLVTAARARNTPLWTPARAAGGTQWRDDWEHDEQMPTAPEYGCTPFLETGDPVVAVGFAMGTNTFEQGPNPNGTQRADGYYHPEDEVTLPWFLRLAPDAVSEPTQSPSPTNGRYTFMGDRNPFPGFRQPATGC